MSFWDDLGETAGTIIKENSSSIGQSAASWFSTTVLGQKAPTTPVATPPQTPAPSHLGFATQNMTAILLVGVGILALFLFKRGR